MYQLKDKRASVFTFDNLLPQQRSPGAPPISDPTRFSRMARKSQRLSRQLSDKDFLHRQIAEIDKRDDKIAQYESLLSTLKSCKTPIQVMELLVAFEQNAEKAVAATDEIKDEVYRLTRQRDEMEIVISEQNEKLEMLESAGVLTKDGSAVNVFEESARYKEMGLMIAQLRQAVEERDVVVRQLKAQVVELRAQVRDLELNEFEHLEQLASAGILKDRNSIGSLESLEGKLALRLRESEMALDREIKAREIEKEESVRKITSLEGEMRVLRIDLLSRISVSSIDDVVE
ncbi:hypothetical protein BC830DRAFT_93034 [Chytriomyces sp. MP71]|nr:hypothetical protein BC830DRAFT_93034 [Chytriomyces sp. MP71]